MIFFQINPPLQFEHNGFPIQSLSWMQTQQVSSVHPQPEATLTNPSLEASAETLILLSGSKNASTGEVVKTVFSTCHSLCVAVY